MIGRLKNIFKGRMGRRLSFPTAVVAGGYEVIGSALTIGEVSEGIELGDALKPFAAMSLDSPVLVVAIGKDWKVKLAVNRGVVEIVEVEGVNADKAIFMKGPAIFLPFPAKALRRKQA